jgi:MYXO-CTERM domain-containing protein
VAAQEAAVTARHAGLVAVVAVLATAGLSDRAAADPGAVVSSFSSPIQAPYHATYPLGLAHDGTNLYIANIPHAYDPDSPGRIFSVDPATGAVRGQIDYSAATGGQTLKQLTWNGRYLWAVGVTSISGSLVRSQTRKRIDVTTGSVDDAYVTAPTSRGMAWDYACGTMWDLAGATGDAHELPTNEVHLRDVNTGASTYTFSTTANHDGWYSLAHDGCSLWTIDYPAAELVRLDVTTGAELERLPTPGAKSIGLTFDGTHLVVSDQGTDMIYRIEIGPAALASGSCSPGIVGAVCRAPGQRMIDAGMPDAAPGPDSGDPGEPGAQDGGGGCAAGEPSSPPVAWLVAALVLGLRRTRRRALP